MRSAFPRFAFPVFFPFFVEAGRVSLAAAFLAAGRGEPLQEGACQEPENNEANKSAHFFSPAAAFAGQSMPARQSGVICLKDSRFATLDCSIDIVAARSCGFCSANTVAPPAIATTVSSNTSFAPDMESTPYVSCSTDPSLPNGNSDHSGMEGLRMGALPAGLAKINRGHGSNFQGQFIPSYGLSSRDKCIGLAHRTAPSLIQHRRA